jgi:NAD(P)-dependent dehydrogenase (short-subunit alcohol dehydrogenase family)
MAQTGKIVVITGATKGLGKAMAGQFARAGCRVAGCGRSREAVELLQKEFGPAHLFQKADVISQSELLSFSESVLEKFGPPDFLINNAAVINSNAPLWEIPAREFDQVIDINIKGVANVIRAFAPSMALRASGVIVNFSSGWGRSTSPEVAPYCATKWAIEGLTQALAQELPDGMAAVPLNPGVIDTEMLRSCFGGSAEAYQGPEEWAKKAVPFILSLTARNNGQSLSVPD